MKELLAKIEEAIVIHGGDLGGWTLLHDESLQLFDGRLNLTVEPREEKNTDGLVNIHVHLRAELTEYDGESLNGCFLGIDSSRDGALNQIADVFVKCVAAPARALLDQRQVCNAEILKVIDEEVTSILAEDGDDTSPVAYSGPSLIRGDNVSPLSVALEDDLPWFHHVFHAAGPERFHLIKVVLFNSGSGWERRYEVDGLDVCFVDGNWPMKPETQRLPGIIVRFAIIECLENSPSKKYRFQIDRAIHRFTELFVKHLSVTTVRDEMHAEGFDTALTHEVISLAPLAFGREVLSAHQIWGSPFIIRAHADGRVETDVSLNSQPAFARAMMLTPVVKAKFSKEEYWNLAWKSSPEASLMLEEMRKPGVHANQLRGVFLNPAVVPELGVSEETLRRALNVHFQPQKLPGRKNPSRKKWWLFWR